MVFSATKGIAATVIHRLVDRDVLSYDESVAEYWPEFAANGKDDIRAGCAATPRAGLSHLKGVTKDQLLDHLLMEEKLAAAGVDHLRGWPAYHALTYGWILSGLARAVTGMGMRDLVREEVARPLITDGAAPRPPARGGIKSFVQGDIPFLDGEVPAANGVVTARGLARMYAAIANGGAIDGEQFLSAELAQGLIGNPRPWPDLNLGVPMPFHLGYHESPVPGLLEGFGHIGLGGTLGRADPGTGSAFAFVHNRLSTPMVLDMASFAGLARPLRTAITAARRGGAMAVPKYGGRYRAPAAFA